MPLSAPRPRPSHRRVTLDSQLLTYWEREASRLDALAAATPWGWIARGYARKAERARMMAARSADRETARGQPPQGAPEDGEPAA